MKARNGRAAASPPAREPIGPAPAGPGVVRTRLLDRMDAGPPQRIVSLTAPAGCGKTHLLLAWRRRLAVDGVDVAWVAFEPGDDDPDRFLDAILAGLAGVDPALVREPAVLAQRGGEPDATEAVLVAMVRAIAARPRPLALVLDDAHHLADARAVAALQWLLDHAPPGLRCALASRSGVPLSTGRWRARGELTELGWDDLRFTAAEAAGFVGRALGEVDPAECAEIYDRTQGWAAGLELVCLDRRTAKDGRTGPKPEVRDAGSFARYVEHEVLARLEPAVVELLVRCAVPEHLDAALCKALAGPALGHLPLVTRLADEGLFVLPAGPRHPDGWWRLHPLLRDVLLTRLARLPQHERQALHAIAWRFFAARGLLQDAVDHALRAQAPAEAAALVEGAAPGLFDQGELRQLADLVRRLPHGVVRDRPGLRLWLAYGQLHAMRLDDCERSIADLRDALRDASPAERYRLTLLRALHAAQRDDWARAAAILPELQAMPPDADAIARSGRRNLLTWIHLYAGDYEQARRVQLDDDGSPGAAAPPRGSAFGLLAGRCLVGLTHAVEGRVVQAERIYRDVLHEAESRGPGGADAGTLAAGLLGEVLYELNDWPGALALLEPRLEVLEQVSIPDTVLRVMLALGRSRWLAGRPMDALEGLEQAQDKAARGGLDRLLAYCLLERLQFRLQRRELSDARAAMEELEALDVRHAAADRGTMVEIPVVAARARIRIDLYTGDLPRALERLRTLTEVCARRGRARRVPYLLLQSAVVLRELRRHDESLACVRDALRHGHRLGLVRTMLDAHEDVPALLGHASRDEVPDPVLSFYAERLQAAAREAARGAPPPPGATRPGLEVLSPREGEIVRLLLQAHSNKRIARALELSPDTVKWHLKNAYAKLEASGRDDVVERFGR